MPNSTASASNRAWNSNDLYVRLHEGGELPEFATESAEVDQELSAVDPRGESPLNLPFDTPSLAAVECDDARHESLSVLRSGKPSARHVLGFAARNKSTWALDVLVSRFTRGGYDWASVRSAALRFNDSPRALEPVLDRIKLSRLWSICEALHARGMDDDAELGLLRFVAIRLAKGGELDSGDVESLIENLLNFDLADEARKLVPLLKDDSWMRHALTVDLEHPRFGGSYESQLVVLNEAYRRFGLETVSLEAEGSNAFERLYAESTSVVEHGPLISVIMTCWSPGTEIFTAVRSIVGQTYQNWELIVTDDASSSDYECVLSEIESIDARIRVLRNAHNAGTYVRRNEAIAQAHGEYVTVQDSDDWSHPRRLEIQVRDLEATPGRFANVVRAARVTDQFSTVSPRGAKLFISEPSILFRRVPVLDAVGFFDTTRKGADTEFRQRLEIATRVPVRVVGPEIPLEFMLADTASLSGSDFGKTLWTAQARLAYRSSTKRLHDKIRAGEKSPIFPIHQERRLIQAPPKMLGNDQPTRSFDLLIIADGHGVRPRAHFIETIVAEIRIAVSSGQSVALLHSDSVSGVQNAGPLAGPLQALIDEGRLVRVFEEDQLEVALTVVRHAGAIQGHPMQRLPMTTDRAIVVEDHSAGDIRGVTIAKADIIQTAEARIGCRPEWAIAQANRTKLDVLSVVVTDNDTLRLTIKAVEPEHIMQIQLVGIETVVAIPELKQDGLLQATVSVDDLPSGNIELVATIRTQEGNVAQTMNVPSKSTLTRRARRNIISKDDGGIFLTPSQSEKWPVSSTDELNRGQLDATITAAAIFRESVDIQVESAADTKLLAVYALREVNGNIRRREFSTQTENDGLLTANVGIGQILDVRWKVFGSFETAFGIVEAPLQFDEQMFIENSDRYRIRQLSDDGIDVLHVVPIPDENRGREAPLLSVVMPVYNVGPYLDTAIRSVLTQDLTDLELIIIDDASSDNGRQIIEMHQKLDSRIRVIELDHNTLGGAGIPSNLGIKAARGKYLAFVDSDDWVTDGIFTKLVATAEANDVELVVGDFRIFGDNDRSIEDAYDAAAWREIPLGEVISAYTHPALLRLSAVPWRKLYRRSFLTEHNILYPEGDYFYEDNPLHWFVLSRAERIVAVDDVISFHRMERDGQTMGASQYKLGAVACHANTIYRFLATANHENREVLFSEFFSYMERLKWAVKRQVQPAAAKLIQRGLADTYSRALAEEPKATVSRSTRQQFEEYQRAYGDLDLTIIIPAYNSADLIGESIESVLEIKGISYNILVVDDGSSDDTFEIIKQYEKKYRNVHAFRQNNRGAGRARNSVIPLATGRYTYFLDSDDVVEPEALTAAVTQADIDGSDLLFGKYGIDYSDEKRLKGMFKGDQAIWKQLESANGHADRQRLFAGLINYPWNRVIRTSLLHDSNIFFGPTVVHNDVLFHWHSTLAARNIGYLDQELCCHRKFKTRSQVTNIADERRMAVLESLRGTHERISDLDSFQSVQDEWQAFALHLLNWAELLIPQNLVELYRARAEILSANIRG